MGWLRARAAVVATLALAIALLAAGPAAAQHAVELMPGRALRGLVPDAEVLEDPRRALSLDEARAAAGFRPAAGDLNVGYSSSAYWVRFSLRNATPARGVWMLELFRTGDAVLHELSPEGVRTRGAGASRPFGEREVLDPNIIFSLELPAMQERTYYVRLESPDTLDLTPRLWSEREFFDRAAAEAFVAGAYYGVMLALVLYNLFVFVGTRASGYGSYVVFQLGYVLMQAALDRYTFRHLWANSPTWAARSEIVFAGVTVAGAAAFAREFLELSRLGPRTDRVLRAWIFAAIALAATGLVTSHTLVQQAGMLFVATSCFLFIGAGVLAWMRHSPNAPFYLVAWIVFVSGTLADFLTAIGLLARAPSAMLWLRIGSASEALLLAFALANRINLVRRDKERATEALDASRRLHAETLERRVEERTRELEATLASLEATQRKLAQEERLASLGRLVAGVAHEINNPLNFSVGGAAELRRQLDLALSGIAALRDDPGAAAELARAEKALSTAARALELVGAGNARIATIVKNLQAYVQLGRLAREPTDLVAQVERTLDLAADRLEEAGIRVDKDLAPLPEVPCCAGELGQVFMNLVVNACQAMSGGGHLRVSSRFADDVLSIVFHDSGAGIPEENRDAIFEPFFTTRAPGEGTGLGLSISHEIVKRHGGELRVLPTDRGAAFEVRLPADGRRTSTSDARHSGATVL